MLFVSVEEQSILKIFTLFNLLEVLHRIACFFGRDVFEALQRALCRRKVRNSSAINLPPLSPFLYAVLLVSSHAHCVGKVKQVFVDALLAIVTTILHVMANALYISIIQCAVQKSSQAVLFHLLITVQFGELKPILFKSIDMPR